MAATDNLSHMRLISHHFLPGASGHANAILRTEMIEWAKKKGTIMELHEAIMNQFYSTFGGKIMPKLRVTFRDAKKKLHQEIRKASRERSFGPSSIIRITNIFDPPIQEGTPDEENTKRIADLVQTTVDKWSVEKNPNLLHLQSDLMEAFFPYVDENKPVDKWDYYDDVNEFIKEHHQTHFQWLDENTILRYHKEKGYVYPIPEFSVRTRKASVRILEILDVAALAKMPFKEILK